MGQSEFWQAPGNGKCFDSKLEDWREYDKSQRSIAVLKYIKEYPFESKSKFERDIGTFLETNYSWEKNNSIRGHFYRPIQFVEFILNDNNNLSLSPAGKSFLKEIDNENYEKALNYYLSQLLRTSYPNDATEDCFLSLFPFRIMFKLFDEYESIHTKFFLKDIPTITNYEDVLEVKKLLENKDYIDYLQKTTIKKIRQRFNLGDNHINWRKWVVLSLTDIGILEKEGKEGNEFLSIANSKKKIIHDYVHNMDYRDMFFETEEDFDRVKNKTGPKKRNPAITNEVLKEENYKCFFNKNHITFSGKARPHYVEGHHIIHISYQDNFEAIDLDCKENIIPLCPNCHKAIHLSTYEHKKHLLKYIMENHEEFDEFRQKLEYSSDIKLDVKDLIALSYNKSSPNKNIEDKDDD